MSAPRLHAISTSLALLAGSAAVLVSSGTSAQEAPRPDTSEWKCEQCPFARGHEGEYELGAAYASEDGARFGNGTGYDEEGGYVVANGEGQYADDDYRTQWQVEDLGLDSRAVSVEGGKPGLYEYRLNYSELPYRRYDTTETVFDRSNDERLVLPSGWVPAGTTAGFSALDASLHDRNIESDRQTVGVGGEYRGIKHLRLEADFQRTERDGWGITGAPFYQSSALLAAPLDDHTDTVSAAATYERENWSAALSWSGSFYENSNQELRWDNPYLGGGQGALAQAPDNDAQTIALEGFYRFAPRTVVSLSAAFGEMRQDQSLLAYTINPAVPVLALPSGDADAEIDTTHVDVGITSRPWSFLRLRGVYRYDDRDNKTPVQQWTRTITDLFDSGEAEANRPYSFRRNTLELSAAARFAQYEFLEDFEFEGGFKRVEMDRTLQEVEEDVEETGWGRLRWRSGTGTEVSVRAGASRRDPDQYDATVAAANEQNPLMRKYTLAYRFRDFAQLNARMDLSGLPISIGGEFYYSTTDYSESPLGLRKGDDRRFVADCSWTISEHASAYVQGGYEDIELASLNSETFGTADWRSEHRDRFRTFGAGVKFSKGRFDTSVSLQYARGTSDIDVDSSFSGAGAYPELETELTGGEIDVGYHLSDAIDVRLRLRYEDFSSSDWALEGVEPATIPTVLTLGADPDDYDVFLTMLSVRYSFGRTAATKTEAGEQAEEGKK